MQDFHLTFTLITHSSRNPKYDILWNEIYDHDNNNKKKELLLFKYFKRFII